MKTMVWKQAAVLFAWLTIAAVQTNAMTDQEAARAATAAQMASRNHAALLDCKLDSMVSSGTKDWRTSYGSYTADTVSFKRYVVKVMNHEDTTNEYRLVWSFVGRVDGGRTDTVVERGEKRLRLAPKETVEESIESQAHTGRKAVYRALGETDEEGIKVKGLVVQLVQSGQVIRTWYSAQQWKNRSWLIPFEVK